MELAHNLHLHQNISHLHLYENLHTNHNKNLAGRRGGGGFAGNNSMFYIREYKVRDTDRLAEGLGVGVGVGSRVDNCR